MYFKNRCFVVRLQIHGCTLSERDLLILLRRRRWPKRSSEFVLRNLTCMHSQKLRIARQNFLESLIFVSKSKAQLALSHFLIQLHLWIIVVVLAGVEDILLDDLHLFFDLLEVKLFTLRFRNVLID